MEGLKKCPFCNGKAEVEIGTDGALIKCSICGIRTEYYKDTPASFSRGGMGNLNDFRILRQGTDGIQEAIQVWNRRCCE